MVSPTGVPRYREKYWNRMCARVYVCVSTFVRGGGNCCTQREALGEEETVTEL